MKKVFTILLIALFCVSSFAQSPQNLGIDVKADASIGHTDSSYAKLGLDNWVTYEFRHCAKYAKTSGHLFWKKTVVDQEACAADPSTLFNKQRRHNLVTDAGFAFIASQISGTAGTANCNYIAVSSSLASPVAGDTTLTGEIATNGLSRATGTFNYTAGTKTYTLAKTFTASGTQASQGTGVFTASSAGTLCFEATYTAVTVNNTDTLTVTWTVAETGS